MSNLSFEISVTEKAQTEVKEGTCDSCGKTSNVFEIRKYSIGNECTGIEVCLPCNNLIQEQ